MSRLNRGMLQPVYDRVTSVEQLGGVQINKVKISDTFQGQGKEINGGPTKEKAKESAQQNLQRKQQNCLFSASTRGQNFGFGASRSTAATPSQSRGLFA